MRGEGIWRNDESRQLHRRDTWRDDHGLRRYMIERGKNEGMEEEEEEVK